MAVLPLPKTSHAKPKRGEKFVWTVGTTPSGTPGSPGNTMPSGAVGKTFDWTPKLKPPSALPALVYGGFNSQRKPRLRVRRGRTFQLSWTNADSLDSWKLRSRPLFWRNELAIPNMKSACESPVAEPVKRTWPDPSQLPVSRKWFHW